MYIRADCLSVQHHGFGGGGCVTRTSLRTVQTKWAGQIVCTSDGSPPGETKQKCPDRFDQNRRDSQN